MENTKIFKLYNAEIKGVDTEKHLVTAVVSSKSTDRDGDVIPPDAFKKDLKYYKEHPVLLSSHRGDALTRNIGEAKNVKITDQGVEATFEYYVGAGNQEADWGFYLAQKGIASYSIGFIGHEFEWIKQGDMVTGRKFTRVELMEISQVTIPSNRQALQSLSAMAGAEKDLAEMVIKGMDKGEIVEPKAVVQDPAEKKEPVAEKKEEKAQDAPKDTPQDKAYDDMLFGKGDGNDHKPVPINGKDIADAVSESIKQAFKS